MENTAAAPAPQQAPGQQRASTSLYVGDLPIDLPNPEDALFSLFNKVGMVMSIKVCRDISSQRSLGYAYVNFQNPQDAERALESLNYSEIRPGRCIRVMWSSRDPSSRKSGEGNLFVKNLDPSVDTKTLRDTFSVFGEILSVKLAMNDQGKSLGYGFVHFDKEENAKEAIERVDGITIGSTVVQVSPFIKKVDRQKEEEKVFKSVYMKNLSTEATEESVKKIVAECGTVASVFVSSHPQHKTKFALVVFEEHEAATAAIEKLNGTTENSETEEKLVVCRALKKRDRQAQKAGNASANLYQSQGRNIYVKHLDDSINKEKLEELFAQFGKITSSALMYDPQGNFRGFGFVCFEAKEGATAAIREMNGKMVYRRPLYVSQAQQKDMRYQMLEEQRKNMTQQQQRMSNMSMGMYNNNYNNWNMGPGGFMGGRPPMNFMNGPPNPFMMMRGGRQGGPMPPRMMPRAPPKMMPQQQMGGMMPQNRYTQPPQGRPPQGPMGVSAQDLANMSPEEQKNALGERLYVRIQEINPQQAAKITGMLLEMDTPEILNVLEDRNTLMAKVEEAVAVLQQHGGNPN